MGPGSVLLCQHASSRPKEGRGRVREDGEGGRGGGRLRVATPGNITGKWLLEVSPTSIALLACKVLRDDVLATLVIRSYHLTFRDFTITLLNAVCGSVDVFFFCVSLSTEGGGS